MSNIHDMVITDFIKKVEILTEQKLQLLEALNQACEDCGCSLKGRISGHLTNCRTPEWLELIAKAGGK